MTDTNHIEVLRAVRSVFDHIPQPCAERDALDAAITALSARASAGEGVRQRNPAFVGEWHARAVALGYDGVADMLHSVERGEPPLHVAEVMARAAAAAPQPAQAGASGGSGRWLAEQDAKHLGTGYLVDGERVAPDRIEIIAAAPQPQEAPAQERDDSGPYEFGAGIPDNPKAKYWQDRAYFWRSHAIALGYVAGGGSK